MKPIITHYRHYYYIVITLLLHHYYFIITKGKCKGQASQAVITLLLRVITSLLHQVLLLLIITYFSFLNLQMVRILSAKEMSSTRLRRRRLPLHLHQQLLPQQQGRMCAPHRRRSDESPTPPTGEGAEAGAGEGAVPQTATSKPGRCSG